MRPRPRHRHRQFGLGSLSLVLLLAALALPLSAGAAPAPAKPPAKKQKPKPGTLTQLQGKKACLVDRSAPSHGCGRARALLGPGPFMGSRAIAISRDGRSVYVASSASDAIASFRRDPETGVLTQPKGAAGCVAAKGASGCGTAIGLDGPNSVAVSPDGRNVYATSRDSATIDVFRRNPKTGALTQLPAAAGCVSGLAIPVCASARALSGPDVVVISPDGASVYVGSFFGNAVATFARDKTTGALVQPAGSAGCIAESTATGCAPGLALGAVEGLAIANDGSAVYAGSALSNAVAVLTRDTATGALSQATNTSGCIVNAALANCVTGAQLSGANAVAVGPGKNGGVYVTSLFSNSVTSFTQSGAGTGLAQLYGTAGCLVYLRATGCSFGRALVAPEGLAVSPDGASVYAAAFETGAIAVLNRNPKTNSVRQKPGPAGCLAARSVAGCTHAQALDGVSSLVVSPDGRNVYSTSFESNAVDVFRRNK